MRLALALALAALAITTGPALAANFIDTSAVTIKYGKMQTRSHEVSTVNVTVTNSTDKLLSIVAVACTALVNGEPVETNHDPIDQVQPKQTAYGSVSFFELKGEAATASCRVQYVRVD